ncbi:MAG: hypothetical protein H7A51_03765 [Akkermansiaceae bacterium]|nr:hypothetical protein [Akkermansiaceae bacterium]
MNKHRNKQRRLSITEMTLLGLAALVLMTGGFLHAWLKNSHVEVMRDVDKAQQRISDHEDSINSLQVKIDKKLNIYQIRDDLVRAGSKLRDVPASSVEKIHPHSLPQVAKSPRDSSAVAKAIP